MPGRIATGAQDAPGPALRQPDPTADRSTPLRHGAVALLAGGCAFFLAAHHPLSPVAAVLACALFAATAAWRPLVGLAALLLLLPLLGLAPWTGWLTVEEFDLALLAVAAGAWGRRGYDGAGVAAGNDSAAALKAFALFCYAAALVASMSRGFVDAGGLTFGWWQGYHEPMNSLRLAKSFFLALLLLPPWRLAQRQAPAAAGQALATALVAGLLLASLLALWERWAYTGLANFSSDYRTSALFWEMHVGGAALDGYLALTLPFAVRELLRARTPLHAAWAAVAVLLGAYASLTTFSRALYLALPIALALMFGLDAWQRRRAPQPLLATPARPALRSALVGWLLFGLAVVWVFPTSGYRGLLALLGATLLLLPLVRWLRPLRAGGWVAAAALAVIVVLLLLVLSSVLPKGPYIAYTIAWSATAAVLVALQRRAPPAGASGPAALLFAGYVGVLSTMPQIAEHWGGNRAFDPMAGAALMLLALAVAGAGGEQPRWPPSWRWQGRQAALLACTGVLAGVLMGGDYMDQRFASGSGDLAQRVQHWKRAYWLIDGPWDWLLGKGTGRYPANQFMSGLAEDQVGDYRLRGDSAAGHLVLTGGKHTLGWGELFRVSQRIGDVDGAVTLAIKARTDSQVALHVEICRKHLLYDEGCSAGTVVAQPLPGQWQSLALTLAATDLSRGDWFAPRLRVFSIAVESPGRSIEIDQLSATDAGGRQLLANGDFSAGMARWFFSSDRFHMPWHLKSLPLHLLFEQGVVGALLFAAIGFGALWRVTAGSAREHPLASALAASLAGFGVVGLFDSLLDAPRVACLFYLLALVALTLPARRPGAAVS